MQNLIRVVILHLVWGTLLTLFPVQTRKQHSVLLIILGTGVFAGMQLIDSGNFGNTKQEPKRVNQEEKIQIGF